MSCRRIISYITAAAFAVTALFALSSCDASDNEDDPKAGFNYYFDSVISGSPATLDPQTCENDCAAEIIANVFLGLYGTSDGGVTVPRLAEECTVSDDGLEWSFSLREGIYWYGKDNFSAECTADDFVFAFQRLMSPELRSERAKEYYCIKNAEEINTGKIKDPDMLGVKSEGKYSLRITLKEPRSDFRALLAAAPAMPCNREYYELTEGQYGLTGDCVGSNGAFYVSRWHYDKWTKNGNFIELKRNTLNADTLNTAPRGVTYNINADGFTWFTAGDVQVCRTANSEEILKLSGKYGYSTYSTSVWGVLFNTKGTFSSSDLRIALGGYVSGSFDGEIYTSADRIVPDGITVGGADYRTLAGTPETASFTGSELTERGERAMRGVKEGSLSGLSILMPEGTGLKQELGLIIQQWQHNFGIYCLISEQPYDSYISALSSGNFDIALVRLGGGGSGALAYLNCFSSGASNNYGNVYSRKLEDILNSAATAENNKSAARYCLEAEQFIIDNGYFAPLCFEKEYVFRANGVSGVGYDPFTGIYLFGSAVKK